MATAAKAGSLRRAKRQATLQDSKKKDSAVTPRPRKDRDLKTYSARVSHALESARVKRGWTVEDLQTAIKAAGGPEVPISTLYAYELGKANKGVDVPMNLFPAIARAFGYKSAAGWLPTE
jgi:ribosome-binding protein aMBF1 (putative translation factor)